MSSLDMVIADGTLVTARGRRRVDIGIRAGRVAAVRERGAGAAGGPRTRVCPFAGSLEVTSDTEVIDAAGKLVFPGLIDAHTHFGLGSDDAATSDDFYSGTVAAAAGGVTTVIDFATPEGAETVAEAVARRRREAATAVVDYALHGVIIGPAAVNEIPTLVAGGVSSFKLYMAYKARGLMATDDTLAGALAAAAAAGGLAGVHAEDNDLVDATTARLASEGRATMPYFAEARPAEAERLAIARACRLAGEAGAPLYVFHLSTAAGLEEIRRARRAGVTVWAETCPHYLTFTDEVYARPDGYRFTMNPPLRRREDVDALWAGLARGEIQVVSSDHCPFPLAAKAGATGAVGGGTAAAVAGGGPTAAGGGAAAVGGPPSFVGMPAGVGGTEMILPVLLSEGAAKGRLSLERVAEVTSANPARIFGLYPGKGRAAVRALGDFAIVDPDVEWTVGPSELHSRCDYTPYEGLRARGRVVVTVARGRVIYRHGGGGVAGAPGGGRARRVVAPAGSGRFVERRGAGSRPAASPVAAGGSQSAGRRSPGR